MSAFGRVFSRKSTGSLRSQARFSPSTSNTFHRHDARAFVTAMMQAQTTLICSAASGVMTMPDGASALIHW